MGTVRAIAFLLLCLAVSVSFFVSPNYAAIPMTGPPAPGMDSYDRIVPAFMAKYNVPGGAVAVVKDGRLVFAHGYGYADTTGGSPVQPYSLFRIASLSKQITAVTILKLVEEGRLSLDDKAFSILNIKPPNGVQVQDQRIFGVTIRELLEHSGGWDSSKTFDPMFDPFRIATFLGVTCPPSREQIIQYMLTQPLQFDPGAQYAYSNFGYLILGRVIETVTGQPYEDYVRTHVLAPMGIADMKIGHTLAAFAAPSEVHYYDYPGAELARPVFPNMTGSVPWPYGGFYLEDMDSHGGWIASAVDIVRFAASIDGAKPPAFLSPAMVRQMSARPPAPLWAGSDYWYGFGWLVREPAPGQFTLWHTGSLPGTMTTVVRAYDGLVWAALFNTRPSNSDQAFTELDSILWEARNAVTSWPTNDLFNQPIPEFSSRPLTPSDLRGAYDVNPLLNAGYTGRGVTVAIVEQRIDNSFYSDLKSFGSKYGLPDPNITVVQPYGSGGTLSTDEITADTEFVHAMAPDAKILLVLVGTHSFLDGFSYVIDHNAADIATMSAYQYYYGERAADRVQSYNTEYAKSVSEKITLITSSGDYGSNNTVPWVASGTYSGDFWTKHLPSSYMMPAYSEYVTVVGGTALTLQSGAYGSEIGWSQSAGGPSNLFHEPSWQTGAGVPKNGFRNMPDIALDASCDTPYAFDWHADNETSFCGTSAAAPTFAGIMADIEQAAGGRLGFLNPALYSLASSDPSVYHDVTSGCSLLKPNPNDNVTEMGYCAQAGWDFVTGWGSIDATKLVAHLAPSARIISPSTTSVAQLTSTTSTISNVIISPGTTSATIGTMATTSTSSNIGTTVLGFAILLMPVIVVILVVLYVRARRRRLAPPVMPIAPPVVPSVRYCLQWGRVILQESIHCEHCGARQSE